jgi:hypothetical protein
MGNNLNIRKSIKIFILVLLFLAVIIYYETHTVVYDCSIVSLQPDTPKEVLGECEKLKQEEINEIIDWYRNNRNTIKV